MHYLHANGLFHSYWIKTVHDIWLTYNTFYSQASFKNKVKTRITDQFKQEWNRKVNVLDKFNYKLHKKNSVLKNI